MQIDALKALLESRLPECEFVVESNDGKHFQVIAIGDVFARLSTPVKKQQLVMQQLADEIANNEVHAVALKTFTPDQWAAYQARQIQ